MAYIPPEVILEVKQIDLLSYLQTSEPQELIPCGNNTFKTKKHDSLKISNGKWMWWSRNIGGRSALDYLVKVRGMTFLQAVETLVTTAASVPYEPRKPPGSSPKKLELPRKNSDSQSVRTYLLGRGIFHEIIEHCLENGTLFESRSHHSCVFVGFDGEGNPRYGAYRGTGKERIMGELSGSDKRFSFRLTASKSSRLHVFEGAIDLLSYAALMAQNGREWRCENLLSLGGVFATAKEKAQPKLPMALENFLQNNKDIRKVFLHLDNDSAGQKAAQAIQTTLENEYEVCNSPPPFGRDVNDYLRMTQGRERNFTAAFECAV